jgi:hypothetical protein
VTAANLPEKTTKAAAARAIWRAEMMRVHPRFLALIAQLWQSKKMEKRYESLDYRFVSAGC